MEGTTDTPNDLDKVFGMMHLILDHGENSNTDLHQLLKDVYHNFTSLHDAATSQLEILVKKFRVRSNVSPFTVVTRAIEAIIAFCKCSLIWVVRENETINYKLATLLADFEQKLLDLIKDSTTLVSSRESIHYLNRYKSILRSSDSVNEYLSGVTRECYSPFSSYRQIIDDKLMLLEFINQVFVDLNSGKLLILSKGILINKLTFLRKYLELTANDRINTEDANSKLLSSIYIVASKILLHSFLATWSTYISSAAWEKMETDVRITILRPLGLQLESSIIIPRMSDQLLVDYVDCIQDSLIELQKIGEKAKDDQLIQMMSSHEGICYVASFLIGYQPLEQEKVSDIRVHFQALIRNVGCAIYSCFFNLQYSSSEEERNLGLNDVIKKLNLIQEEVIEIVAVCIISDRAAQEYPKVYPLGFLIFVLDFLKKLMDSKSELITGHFDTIIKNLLLSISFLKTIENNSVIEIEDNGTTYYTSKNTEELDDIKTLIQHSIFMINYLKSDQIDGEELCELLISAQDVAFKIARYFLSRKGGFIQWWEVYSKTEDGVVDLHVRVGILRAFGSSIGSSNDPPLTDDVLMGYWMCIQDNMVEFVKDMGDIDPLKDQFKILHDGLSNLIHLIMSYMTSALMQTLPEIKESIQALLRNVGHVICLRFNNQVKANIRMEELSVELMKLNEKLSLIEYEIMGLHSSAVLRRIGVESPKTAPLVFLSCFLENWKELMECKSDLIVASSARLQTVHEHLSHFRSFLQNVKEKDTKIAHADDDGDESRIICKQIASMGYMAEYVISTFVGGSCPVRYIPLWLSELTEYIELISANVVSVNDKDVKNDESRNSVRHPSQVSSEALTVPTSIDVVVGFEVEMKLLIERVTASNVKQLDVISITGMPGLGKTTLARKVYEDSSTVNYFDIRAWCSVSQEYNKKELFLIIVGAVVEVTELIRRKSEADLAVMVHKELTGRRYFIVLDDVWEMDAFMDLKLSFPDNNNRSRIIMTSRSKAVGLNANSRSSPIEPGLLSAEVSWDLLERKIYHEGKCPKKLRQLGKEIARRCRGLPLSVVLLAGILAKSVQDVDFWEQVAENLSSYLAQDSQSQWMAALELSYKFLPDSLKPLFLYLGAFPEDTEIPADKLIWLWSAEGFVHKNESMSLEIQAEANLMDLVDRSLVMVAKRRSNGSVKACRVHDLLRDMCLAKAKKDNFMQQIHLYGWDDIPDCIAYDQRMSIYLERETEYDLMRPLLTYEYAPLLSITPPLRTLLTFHKNNNIVPTGEGINSVFSGLNLLRVLHSEGTLIDSDEIDDVIMLVHLRYMSIRACWNIIPPSISSICTLETLIVKGVRGEIVVPPEIWKLVKLRHLHINDRASFSAANEASSKLENLVTLSTPVIGLGEEDKFITRVPNIQKLRCVFTEGINSSYRDSRVSLNLEYLCKLESLKVLYHGGVKCTGKFKLPSTLKKLSLSRFRLKWSQISMFQELENLEVLKLRGGSVQDAFWDVGEDDVFSNLKFLKLENLNIERWSACSVNFPSLEKLVLERCRKLEEIPSDLGECETLQVIEVRWCSNAAAKMAKEIQEGQEEFGNVLLKVHIYPPPLQVD